MLHVITDGGYDDWRKQLLDLYLHTPGCVKTGDVTLASGAKSDLYIDSKMVSLSHKGLQLIGACFLERFLEERLEFNAIGGMTVGADPIISACTLLSSCWGHGAKGFIVRKEPKSHGTGKLIEGPLNKGDNVILVEDVTTTGGTLVQATRIVRDYGCKVVAAYTVVDREEGGTESLAKEGVNLFSILVRKDLLNVNSI